MKIESLGLIAKMGDWLMIPIMYLLSGTFSETPQKTHIWNIRDINTIALNVNKAVVVKGKAREKTFGLVMFHIPILGGWRNYSVLEPSDTRGRWYAGWQTQYVTQISLIPICGPVRLLAGPDEATFFGLNPNGSQIEIRQIGEGQIGKGGPFKKVLLL